jgi:hypothetical protein
MSPDREQPGCPDDTNRGEYGGRSYGPVQRRHRRVQPSVEEDQRERDRPDSVGEPIVLERDPANPLHTCQHADEQEDQHDRQPDPLRCARQQCTHAEQRADDEQHEGGREGLSRHEVKLPSRLRREAIVAASPRSYQLSAISYQLSAIRRRRSAAARDAAWRRLRRERQSDYA